MIQDSFDAEVVGAKHGLEGLEIVKNDPKGFDLILSDIHMPVMDGIEMISEIRSFNKDVKILVLSMLDEYRVVRKMVSSNVQGYVLKEGDTKELMQAIKYVLDGEYYYSDSVVNVLKRRGPSNFNSFQTPEWSSSEKRVLELISKR